MMHATLLPILLATGTGEDPWTQIIAIGASCVGGLALALWGMVLGQFRQLRRDISDLGSQVSGRDGMYMRIGRLEKDVEQFQRDIAALKAGTLSRELFENATREQNTKLEELKTTARDLDHKVDKIDRVLISGRSYTPPERAYVVPESPIPPKYPPYKK